MRNTVRWAPVVVLVVLHAWPSAAQRRDAGVQDRPFMFSVSAAPTDDRQVTVQLDSAFGASAFDLSSGERAEQRVGIQAALGHRLTAVAHVGLVAGGGDVRATQQAELLYSVVQSRASRASLALGMGVRHEADGVNVLLGRVTAGRAYSAWRLDGNALFEKPLAIGRDSIDLITSAGISRPLTTALHVGVELVGEDLEGFWEADEAEGGARLLVGPSLRLAPPASRWQVSLAGGPVLHPTRSSRRSTATRGLASSGASGDYAVRLALGYAF